MTAGCSQGHQGAHSLWGEARGRWCSLHLPGHFRTSCGGAAQAQFVGAAHPRLWGQSLPFGCVQPFLLGGKVDIPPRRGHSRAFCVQFHNFWNCCWYIKCYVTVKLYLNWFYVQKAYLNWNQLSEKVPLTQQFPWTQCGALMHKTCRRALNLFQYTCVNCRFNLLVMFHCGNRVVYVSGSLHVPAHEAAAGTFPGSGCLLPPLCCCHHLCSSGLLHH